MVVFSLINNTPVMDKHLIGVGATRWSTEELHDGQRSCSSLLHWPVSDVTAPESLMRFCDGKPQRKFYPHIFTRLWI